MPTDTDADAPQRESVIPEDAGLKSGVSEARPQRSRGELLDAAAADTGLTPTEHDDLVAYYLANEELPGDDEPCDLEVTLGHGRKARPFKCTVHPIEWDEWQDGRERATNSSTQEIDTYVWASWNVARALIRPKLGPTVQRLQQTDSKNAPADAAELLRRMFRKQSGALLELSAKVLEVSKLSNDNDSVREVEAAKN